MLLALFLTVIAFGQTQGQRTSKKRWIVSILALSAATALDLSSSAGRYEMNPLMRTQDGRFAMGRAMALKGGLTAGVVLFQAIALRKPRRDNLEKMCIALNLAGAGALAGIAARNYDMPKAPPAGDPAALMQPAATRTIRVRR